MDLNIQFLQFKMKDAYFLAFLLIITSQLTQFRLNTGEVKTLNVGDALVSTLGHFKATLAQSGCTLQISTFKNSAYVNIGNYTSANVTGNCKSLVIGDGQVVTESNTTYLSLGTGFNLSTILNIDDYGVIRLIGSYLLPNYVDQVSLELVISDFMRNQTYIYAATEMSVSFMNMFDSIVNERNWMFSAQAGQLSISQSDNNAITVSYSYSTFTINNSQIVDFNGNTFPAAIFPNVTFQPRCQEPRLYLNFKPPFLFVANPYWPVFTLYEQGRYKVLEVSLASIFQNSAWQDQYRLQYRNQPNVCPPYTFEFMGSCVTNCPSPYYYEMRGLYGYCVLTCEQFTPKNETSRICSCYSDYEASAVNFISSANCSNDSIAYPYGCYCSSTANYFDRTISLSCVTTCPPKTFASNGLCMQCPNDCQTCQIDKLYRTYLECKVCLSGFTLTNGQCLRTCSPGLGYSLINGVCQQCTDPNCIDCTQNISVCLTCNLLYALESGSCVQTCSNTTTLAPYDDLAAVCIANNPSCSQFLHTYYKGQPALKCILCNGSLAFMHQDKCVSVCPAGYVTNDYNTCYCANHSLITINDKCLPYVTCPVEMGWDPLSNSCLSCNFGCLTCYNSACTSCIPGYFHYISPQGVRCRRKSPLYTCDTQYGWIQKVCLALQYADPNLGLTLCYSSIPNCKSCSPQRSDICVLCNPGYFVHNNTCIKTCPTGTISYNDQVCILPQISNCGQPYLKLASQGFQVDYNKVKASSPYVFYTFNGKESPNDPSGYIPVYQQMIDRKNDGQFRGSQFFHPIWTCLKCNDGYGLSSDFSQCLFCPSNCVTCYLAQNNSCIISKSTPTPTPTPTPQTNVTGCLYYIDSQSNKCVQNCSTATSQPRLVNGVLYCYQTDSTTAQNYARIDSAIYIRPDGQKTVFFVLDQTVKSSSTININVAKQGTAPIVGASGTSTPSNMQSVTLQSGNYFSLQDPDTNNDLYVLNLGDQLKNMVTESNLLFPNTIYGATSSQSHPQFMKTWLAYIGYIMGITLILLHVVFIGNDLLYKVDNAIILGQTIYFFSFVQLLVGKLLAQFYYGWIFTHLGFFPNFFTNTIPSNYYEPNAPNSYKLATLDTNIVRNAGFAFSLIIIFIGAYALIAICCWIAAHLFYKTDVWQPKIATNSLIGGLQFISMSVFYWSCANLLYINGADSTDADFYNTSRAVSIFFICIITIYTLARWFFHPIGGLYMAKRILLAALLAGSYQNTVMIAPLIILETLFTIFRFFMESPQKKRDQFYLILEYLIYIGVYLLLWLSLNAGVNTIIISIFMFILIVTLAHDLTEVYLESQNEWLVEEDEDDNESQNMAKAEADEGPKKSSVAKAY